MKIFISYRRKDSQNITDHLTDKLRSQYGTESIFQDTMDIISGQDFTQTINTELEHSDIILVIIGKDWKPLIDEGYRCYTARSMVMK